MPTRRQLLQAGLAGSVFLATAQRLSPAWAAPQSGMRVLDEASARMMGALVPVVLADALPAERAARARAVQDTVQAFDRAVSVLSPAVRGEVEQLFSVLGFAPARYAMAGLWAPLEQASAGDIAQFLQRWRHSRFDIQRSAYQAITQLIQAAWYDNPLAWPGVGYPGPPALP